MPSRTKVSPTWTLVAASLGFAVVQLDVSVVNVAIGPIGADLGGGVSSLQWVVSAYTVALAALILTAGALGDRVGARRVFAAGLVVFTLASSACGLAPDIATLVAARTVQGVGAAALVPCSLSLLNHLYPEPMARARAVGLWAAGASAALSGGPLIGGVLTATLGWRAIFFINVPLGVFAWWLVRRYADETPGNPDRGTDLRGQLAAGVALTALAGATIEGGSHGFRTPWVLGGYLIAVLAGASFVTIERRRAEPMLPLTLFRSPTFSGAAALGVSINIAFYGLIFVFSLYFQRAQHRSPLETGLAFAPMTAAILSGNVATGRLLRRLSTRAVLLLGTLLMAGSTAVLIAVSANTSYALLVTPMVGLGLGLGLVVPAMTSTLMGSVDKARSGVAAGVLNAGRQTGSVVGVALFGAFADRRGLVPGLQLSLVVSAVLCLAGCAFASRIRPATG